MATMAESPEIGETVGFPVIIESGVRDHMVNIKFTTKLFFGYSASLASILVSSPGRCTLPLPIGATIITMSTMPIRVSSPRHMLGPSLVVTAMRTKPLFASHARTEKPPALTASIHNGMSGPSFAKIAFCGAKQGFIFPRRVASDMEGLPAIQARSCTAHGANGATPTKRLEHRITNSAASLLVYHADIIAHLDYLDIAVKRLGDLRKAQMEMMV